MKESKVHLAYAPRGAGLLYGVLWFADGDDIYGWFIGTRDGVHEASYFVMPRYYADTETLLLRSVEDEIDGPWVQVGERGETPLAHAPPVPQALRPELSRLQDEFIRHWLFFDTDPQADAERHALADVPLPMRRVNVRAVRLGKFQVAPAVWRFDTPGADLNVLARLSQRWPLDERFAA